MAAVFIRNRNCLPFANTPVHPSFFWWGPCCSSFLFCVFRFFFVLRSMYCTQCCRCLWIVNSWLPLRFFALTILCTHGLLLCFLLQSNLIVGHIPGGLDVLADFLFSSIESRMEITSSNIPSKFYTLGLCLLFVASLNHKLVNLVSPVKDLCS